MSLRRTLDVLGGTVERATSVPFSASCMVNRAEVLSLVERARAELPAELDQAAALLVAHQDLLATAEREAEQLVQQARTRAEQLVAESALVATARARSEQILDAARSEAARLLRAADEYCDRRLAVLEHDLDRAIGQVKRGRDRLRERSDLDVVEVAGLLPQGVAGLLPQGAEAARPASADTVYDRAEEPAPAGPPGPRVGDRLVDLAGMEAEMARVQAAAGLGRG